MYLRMIVVLAAVLSVSAGLRADDDPFIGTWKLNLAKSKFDPGPPPKNITHTYVPFGDDGLKITTVTVNAKGEESKREYTVKFDGKYYPVPNDPGRDEVSSERPNSYRHEGLGRLRGQVNAHWSRQISKDGKTLTITTDGTNPEGKPKHDIRVFDKM